MDITNINAKLQCILNSVSLSLNQKKLINDIIIDIYNNINTNQKNIKDDKNDKIKLLSEINLLNEDANIEDVIYNFNHLLSILKQNY